MSQEYLKDGTNGGEDCSLLNVSSTLDYLIDSIEYNHAPQYLDKDFLHYKYVLEGLSTVQIAVQIFSSKDGPKGSETGSNPSSGPSPNTRSPVSAPVRAKKS